MYIVRVKIEKKQNAEEEIFRKYNKIDVETEIDKYVFKDYIFGEIKAIGIIDLNLKKMFIFNETNEEKLFEKLKNHKQFTEDISINITNNDNLPLLIGWNIKNFDYPYLISRFVKYYNIKINVFNKHNNKIIDLMNVFSFGGLSFFKLTEIADFYNIEYDKEKINSEDLLTQLKEELRLIFNVAKKTTILS